MVNNLPYQQCLQGQPQRQLVPPVQQVKQQVRPSTPQTFNQQYNQYQVPQASPLWHNPCTIQKFNPLIQANDNNKPHLFSLIPLIAIAILAKYCMSNGNISLLCRKKKKPMKNVIDGERREARDGEKTITARSTQTRHLRR